ncbi:MAG TPA: ROK family protein [Planctomycetaceae bacterium]|nr:ROK family protein [Planctomycetaceae bacterium]HQZ64457.1 ROK family protein [Planctomycetaceae bacterium]HRA86985.1 ROK family protein [Planctomycetaceae bacterium]
MAGSSTSRIFLGLDLGGTNVKAGVVDDDGNVISSCSVPTDAVLGPDAGVQNIVNVGQKAIAAANLSIEQISAVGLATPGTMDIPRGMLLDPPNLPGWSNYPIRDRVAAELKRPTILQNDANAAAYGEYWAGSAKDVRSLLFYTLGTGLGGGVIVDDHIIEGEHSHGSELGHVILEMHDGRLCTSGQYGTAEAYVSANALVKRFRDAMDDVAVTSVRDRLNQGEELTPLLISEEAERGDHLSAELIMEMGRYLGAAITTAVHVIDPAMVLLGGAMTFGRLETAVGREFLHRVHQEFRSRTFATIADKITIEYASLGGDAGFIGAAGCARKAFNLGLLPQT